MSVSVEVDNGFLTLPRRPQLPKMTRAMPAWRPTFAARLPSPDWFSNKPSALWRLGRRLRPRRPDVRKLSRPAAPLMIPWQGTGEF